MIIIKSKKTGFRRCGIAHPKEVVQYPEGRFSANELAILAAEPMLIVEIVVLDAPAERPDNAEPGIQTGPKDLPPAADSRNEQPGETGRKGKR